MTRRSRQSGSALIATLLLVALMLTLLVYFLFMVRLQSQAAGYRRMERRVEAGLNRAIGEAAAQMEGAYNATAGRVAADPGAVLDWVSSGSGEAVTGLVEEALAESLGWPEALQGSGPDSLLDRASRAEWVRVGEPDEMHTVHAWVGVDLTGLIDPNGTERLDTSFLGFLPEAGRTYLSAREVVDRHAGVTPVFIPGGYSVDEGWYDESAAAWRTNRLVNGETVPMSPMEWSEDQIRAVFGGLYPDRDADALTVAFLDYRDGAEVPTDPDGLTAVPVPMLNEVTASLVVSNLGSEVTLTHELNLEVWYPYPDNLNTNRYAVRVTPPLESRAAGPASADVDAQTSDDEWEFESPGGTVDQAFAILTLRLTQRAIPVFEGDSVAMNWNLEGLELEDMQGRVVDRLPAGLVLALPDMTVPPPGASTSANATLEVEDPRLNHDSGRWWLLPSPSLQAVNAVAQAVEDGDPFECWSPPGGMDRAMDPAAMMGHFPIGDPWQTVDLFDEAGAWWMRFTRSADDVAAIGEWRDSRINPNTLYPEAAAAVFNAAAFRRTPDASGTRVSRPQAVQLGEALAASRILGETFTHRGDWGAALEVELLSMSGSTGRHGAEAVLADSLSRFSTRSGLLGIVVLVEVRSSTGRVMARRRRVVLRWIDPFQDGAGRLQSAILRLDPPET